MSKRPSPTTARRHRRRPRPKGRAPLMLATMSAAIVAVGAALIYISAGTGPLHLATILATIFGVGGTILIAGLLMGLMFHSDRSGHDDATGH